MQCLNFEEAIGNIVQADTRYQYGAYTFVQEALKYTQKMLGRGAASQASSGGKERQAHVGGKELLEGVKGYALETYGPMAMTVLAEFGIHSCEDIGEIVFTLITHKLASKSETDSREDFKNGYDFYEAFRKPFIPASFPTAEPKTTVKA
jgi:uncharacterized repeat protein (TIGR04138 family)